jgi:hypothetical protein
MVKKGTNVEKKPGKKRGRKPKGGKIISNNILGVGKEAPKQPNVILHLKCSSSDKTSLVNEIIYNDVTSCNNVNNTKAFSNAGVFNYTGNNNSQQDLWDKINQLKMSLHNNDIAGKRSDCFFCHESFDNPPIHLPKEEKNGIMEVYGCFCSPECAVGYLRDEKLDTSTIWERYALLNNIYAPIYKYNSNIKPAPSPYYTTDKYYGNLDISEYRSMLEKEQLLVVVDKPLTKIYPELIEENGDTPNIYNNLLNTSMNKSTLRLRRSINGDNITKHSKLKKNFNM